MSENIITIQQIIDIGLKKAGSKEALCKNTGINKATLWRIETGKVKNKPWDRTVGKLTRYALGE